MMLSQEKEIKLVFAVWSFIWVAIVSSDSSVLVVTRKRNLNDTKSSFQSDIAPVYCFERHCIFRTSMRFANFSKGNIRGIESIQHQSYFFVNQDELGETVESTCEMDNDGSYWHLARISNTGYHSDDFKMTFNRSSTGNGQGVTAYVIDTGILMNHTSFGSRARHGFTAPDAWTIDSSDHDLNGHGTHVAGVLGGFGFGVSTSVELVAVKSGNKYGVLTEMDIIAGLHYIRQDVMQYHIQNGVAFRVVVNLSFGTYANAVALQTAIRELHGMGIVFVAAAGNENTGACHAVPAKMPEVITVGAISKTDTISRYSNWGSCVDILSPGDDIISASSKEFNESRSDNGTSFSAPMVAGSIANYMSFRDKPASQTEVKLWLQHHATRDVIDFIVDYKETTTPNILLYIDCDVYVSEKAITTNSYLTFQESQGTSDDVEDMEKNGGDSALSASEYLLTPLLVTNAIFALARIM